MIIIQNLFFCKFGNRNGQIKIVQEKHWKNSSHGKNIV